MSAIGQPDNGFGWSTMDSGESNLAVSAMKRTPQKTITGVMAFRRLAGEFKRIPHEVRDVLYFGACVVVRKDQRVPPDLPFEYFFDYFHVSLSSVAMMA